MVPALKDLEVNNRSGRCHKPFGSQGTSEAAGGVKREDLSAWGGEGSLLSA